MQHIIDYLKRRSPNSSIIYNGKVVCKRDSIYTLVIKDIKRVGGDNNVYIIYVHSYVHFDYYSFGEILIFDKENKLKKHIEVRLGYEYGNRKHYFDKMIKMVGSH